MVERINSQAEALGILHPKLRRGQAIVNRNTLTYVLINLRALARIGAAREARPNALPHHRSSYCSHWGRERQSRFAHARLRNQCRLVVKDNQLVRA
jgi:hypothetical protein